MAVGHNSIAGEQLRRRIESIERIEEERKALGEDMKAVFAQARAEGFTPKIMRAVIKRRKMKPADVQEAEALFDTYMHALGMAQEAPLFRHVGLMGVDRTAKESVVEAFKQLVPNEGEIIIKMGGAPIRLFRDKDGKAHAEDVVERQPQVEPASRAARQKPDVPSCDADGAEALGRQAAKDNQPVISNPFPWDDQRRARWDEGWRKETGSDGMGPKED